MSRPGSSPSRSPTDDLVEADPEADDDRLGLAAVDAEGPAQPRGPARLADLEPEEVRADRAPLGDQLDVAGVVPAVGDAVLVRVGLEVVDRGGRRPLDHGFLAEAPRPRRGQQRQHQRHGRDRRGLHGFSFFWVPAASRWARPVIGTNSVGRSSLVISLPSFLIIR